jgi:2-(1,2-epoxy-1,2-dihydrophenyl)acetyl-CoA isomerase
VSDVLLVRREDGVLWLTLNRPDRLNALDAELLDTLPVALESAAHDDGVRVVVLTGHGRGFCAGGDLELMSDGVGEFDAGMARQQAATLLRSMPKPTIAAVNGVAAGAGFTLALACDLRIAADTARFTAGFGAIGLPGDYGGTYHLVRLVGPEQARRLYFLNETWAAAEALERGLVGRVVPVDELGEEVGHVAGALAAGAPLALARMKEHFLAAESAPFARVLELEARGMIDLAASRDFAEGLEAFRARRPPRFTGR